jgi:hypothetical protein
VDRWHDLIGVPTLADAILDRVIHNAYRIDLGGEPAQATVLILTSTCARRAARHNPRRGKAVDNGGLRCGATEARAARRYPPPTQLLRITKSTPD